MRKITASLLILSTLFVLCGCTAPRNIKVMSFNIRLSPNAAFDGENSWNNRKESVIKMIQNEKPDIFGVQEAIYHQAKYLEEHLPEYTKYGVDREGGLEKGEAEACAAFFLKSKYNLIEKGTFWLSETPDSPSKGWDAACFRVVTWTHLRQKGSGGKDIYFMNTHFDHIGVTARMESGKLIVSKIEEIVPDDAILILTGDFNSQVNDPALVPLVEHLKYARTSSHITDSIPTYNAWGKGTSEGIIDHIFYKGLTPLVYRTVKDDYGIPYLSDHYAVTFEASLK